MQLGQVDRRHRLIDRKIGKQLRDGHAARLCARLQQVGGLRIHLDTADFGVHARSLGFATCVVEPPRREPPLSCRRAFARLRPVSAPRKHGTETTMAKAYWVSCYRSISNPEALAEYAKLAGPALAAGGARFLARGVPAQVYEARSEERMVIAEFPSVEAAVACHDGAAYQAALKVFNHAGERDFRIIEGLE